MVVLGIDPGLANCGYGVVARRGRSPRGARRRRHRPRPPAWRPSAAWRRSTRAWPSCSTSTGPTPSRSRPSTSVRTSARPSRSARPAASCCWPPASAACPASTTRPQQVKGAVCGTGRADKEQVARMVQALLVAARAAAPRPRGRRARRRHLPRQPRAARRGGGGRRVIALVAGDVAVRRPDHVVVETAGGVGYRLAVSSETLRQVPGVGRAVSLHTHLVVRDDALALYGFATEEERDLFLLLIGVQSVGPKVALAVLERRLAARARRGARRPATSRACRPSRASASARPSGSSSSCARRSACETDAGETITVTRGDDPRHVARDGLLELGFPPAEAEALLADAEGETAEDLLASALRGARAVSLERIQTPGRARRRGRARPLAAPAHARRVRRAGGAARAAAGLDRGRGRARRGARPRAARRARRAWARPRWRRSSPPSSTCPSCRPPARRSSARATSPRC